MPKRSYNQILDEHLHILIAQGNHEAYNTLRKRYRTHASFLINDILRQYPDTGLSKKELVAVSEEHFIFVISKYMPLRSSFYTFWKRNTYQYLMDYLIDNSYDGEASSFKGTFSLDQKKDEMHSFGEMLAERDDERSVKRLMFEIRSTLIKYDTFFTVPEKALLNLIMQGYSLADFEQSGILKKSQVNLTYKSAIDKLKKYMKLSR